MEERYCLGWSCTQCRTGRMLVEPGGRGGAFGECGKALAEGRRESRLPYLVVEQPQKGWFCLVDPPSGG